MALPRLPRAVRSVQVPLTSGSPRFHRLRIAELRRETADCVSLAFAVPAALRPRFSFTPGQYLTLRTRIGGAEVRRSYSICSGIDDGELRVAVKHVPDGVFSHFANTRLAAGDVLEVMPPAGRFGVPVGDHTYAAFAAGSGITPILAILRTMLVRAPGSRFVLFYGSRTVAQIIFRTALEDLKDRFLGRLSIIHVLSREGQDVPALSGHLDADRVARLLPAVVDPRTIDHALVCGPGGMNATVSAGLLGLGVTAERIHIERFVPAGGVGRPAPAGVGVTLPAFATATIIHDGKTNDIAIAAGERVLEAALRAGLDLPWSCRGGMCSTCRARLTVGTVEMAENYALEPWETAAGYILTCQARPTAGHITVDYDQV